MCLNMILTFCKLMDSSFRLIQYTWDDPLYISGGVLLYFQNFLRSFLHETFTNSVDIDEMRHFIWVFTVCK